MTELIDFLRFFTLSLVLLNIFKNFRCRYIEWESFFDSKKQGDAMNKKQDFIITRCID